MGLLMEINRRILNRNTWPPRVIANRWADIELLSALRRSDEVRIKQENSIPWQYPYIITPLPRMISRASANMLYGEPPELTPAKDTDRQALDFIVSENDLASELVRGALMTSSEGDVYGRIVVAPSVADVPIIEFVSAAHVIPHFNGRFLIGATFVSEWYESATDVYRFFETYEPGAIASELYRGTPTSIGSPVPLDSYPRTENVQEEVLTGMARPLCVFIPNSIDSDPTRGFSDYRGLEARFNALNETATIGQSNMRLSGKKRALIDATYLDEKGRVPKGDDFYIKKSKDTSLDGNGKPLEMLEYSFEAQQTVSWIDHLLDSALMLAGVSPATVGRSVDGGAISGTALRLKSAFSLIENSGKGRHFDRGLAQLLRAAAVIDSRRTTEGGFGRKWSEPDTPPKIERADPLPRDENEAASRLVMLTNAEAISTEEKVREIHPEWDEQQVNDEVARINGENPDAPNTQGAINPLAPPRPEITLPSA